MSLLVKLTRSLDRAASHHRGFVAVMVLCAIILLAALMVEAQARGRYRVQARHGALAELRVQSAMVDAVRQAMLTLANDEELGTNISVQVDIRDACAKFDLNNLRVETPDLSSRPAEEIVMDLLTASGDFQPSERAAALKDWMDADAEGLREANYYERSGLDYRPANRHLATLAELEWVAGFDREMLREKPKPKPGDIFRHGLRELVTVLPVPHPRPTRINVNTAGEIVLQSLLGPGDAAMVKTVLVARQNSPLAGLDLFLPGLDARLQNTLMTYADVRSEFFEIRARAYQPGGATLSAQVLVHRDPAGKVQVLRWTP
jgi:type II secretory pathway component PulK